MPAVIVNILLDAWAAAIGQPAFVTSTVAEITGAPANLPRLGDRSRREVSGVIQIGQVAQVLQAAERALLVDLAARLRNF
jgi:hypothetical protein